MSTPSQLHASILQYIAQLQAAGNSADNGVTDAEPLEIAAQCIVEATGADAKAAKVRDPKNSEGGEGKRRKRERHGAYLGMDVHCSCRRPSAAESRETGDSRLFLSLPHPNHRRLCAHCLSAPRPPGKCWPAGDLCTRTEEH